MVGKPGIYDEENVRCVREGGDRDTVPRVLCKHGMRGACGSDVTRVKTGRKEGVGGLLLLPLSRGVRERVKFEGTGLHARRINAVTCCHIQGTTDHHEKPVKERECRAGLRIPEKKAD